jgi:neuroligin
LADPATSTSTEFSSNVTTKAVSSGTLQLYNKYNNLLCKFASSNYQIYTTALTITVAEGCFLLLLNILIFTGIYHQRDHKGLGGHFGDKKKEELAEADNCSSSSGDRHHFESKHVLVDHVVLSAAQQPLHPSTSAAKLEVPLQEFRI